MSADAGGPVPDWDALWREADLVDADREAWRDAMAYRTRVPDDAVRLARHGWGPAAVIAARTDPAVYWPGRDGGDDFLIRGEEATAALVALADETAKYHESLARLARELRAQYITELAQRLPKDRRWSNERIGEVLGLSRQRVRMILQRKAV